MTRDDNGMWVLVFPQSKAANGTLDPGAIRKDAYGDAKRIFLREKFTRNSDKLGPEFDALNKPNVTEAEFQAVVRRRILKICEESGFSVKTFSSIDGDETFLSIDMPEYAEEATCITKLAARYSCKMPYKEEAYEIMEGGKPKLNAHGKPVCAFAEFEEHTQNDMQTFGKIHCLRMVETRLNHQMSLEWLEKLGVVSASFPVALLEDEEELSKEWVMAFGLKEKKEDILREYFGEEICFFFRWFEFYIYMLVPLAIIGVVLSSVTTFFPDLTLSASRLSIFFSILVLAWAAFFNEIFSNRSARDQQSWGMEQWDPPFVDRAAYRVGLERTYQLTVQKGFVSCVQIGYVLLFVFVIYKLKMEEKEAMEAHEKDSVFVAYGSMLTVLAIKVFNFVWTQLAPKLVQLENPRTHEQADDALAQKLSGIQIFVALWNFIFVAFIRKSIPFMCASDAETVAGNIWAGAAYTEDQLEHLELRYMYKTPGNHRHESQNCLRGCYPATAGESASGGMTSCDHLLRDDLTTYFAVHIVTTIIFLLVPIALNKYSMWKEIDVSSGRTEYSRLQVQAKRYAQSKYEFNSFGGSQIDDFMQFAIGFALLTCFGILYPPLAMMALIANVVEYKLIAYRMVRVTCRPPPKGATGIGAWLNIFKSISRYAIITNTGLAVFQLPPMRHYALPTQLMLFLILEHALLALQGMIDSIIPEKPADVAYLDDFNDSFKLAKQWQNYPKMEFLHAKSRGFGEANLDLAKVALG